MTAVFFLNLILPQQCQSATPRWQPWDNMNTLTIRTVRYILLAALGTVMLFAGTTVVKASCGEYVMTSTVHFKAGQALDDFGRLTVDRLGRTIDLPLPKPPCRGVQCSQRSQQPQHFPLSGFSQLDRQQEALRSLIAPRLLQASCQRHDLFPSPAALPSYLVLGIFRPPCVS